MPNGWDESADAWIEIVGDEGDYARRFILDRPMIKRLGLRSYQRALDLGCGEGRFSRIMKSLGIPTIGIDPTSRLLHRAAELDSSGDYRLGVAEELPFSNNSFDLIVCYMTLLDIEGLRSAIDEITRVMEKGASLLIANLNSFNTAGMSYLWTDTETIHEKFCMDYYLYERSYWAEWGGIRVRNWHRPLNTYFSEFLGSGLALKFFDEPAPSGGDSVRNALYRRAPWFLVMEWEKL